MSDPKFPSDSADRFQVRMPPGLRDRLAELAAGSGRSMNAEIVARLQASVDGSDGPNPFESFARGHQKEALRWAAEEMVAIVHEVSSLSRHQDNEAFQVGAYSFIEEPVGHRSSNPYPSDTPQHASWIAGRAFAVASELKRAAR